MGLDDLFLVTATVSCAVASAYFAPRFKRRVKGGGSGGSQDGDINPTERACHAYLRNMGCVIKDGRAFTGKLKRSLVNGSNKAGPLNLNDIVSDLIRHYTYLYCALTRVTGGNQVRVEENGGRIQVLHDEGVLCSLPLGDDATGDDACADTDDTFDLIKSLLDEMGFKTTPSTTTHSDEILADEKKRWAVSAWSSRDFKMYRKASIQNWIDGRNVPHQTFVDMFETKVTPIRETFSAIRVWPYIDWDMFTSERPFETVPGNELRAPMPLSFTDASLDSIVHVVGGYLQTRDIVVFCLTVHEGAEDVLVLGTESFLDEREVIVKTGVPIVVDRCHVIDANCVRITVVFCDVY